MTRHFYTILTGENCTKFLVFFSDSIFCYKIFSFLSNVIRKMHDSFYVDFEFTDIDYFLLLEDYSPGSENSLFEYLPYMRNANFVSYNTLTSEYDFNRDIQIQDFSNFTKVDDKRTVLEFYDLNLDGDHELIIQKDDVDANGIYDVFNYGQLNPAGEIVFHTTLIKIQTVDTETQKTGDVRVGDKYKTNTMGYSGHNIRAQRTIITNSTITRTVEQTTIIVQKDLDLDGVIDKDIMFESVNTYTDVITFTTEINDFYVLIGDLWWSSLVSIGSVKQYRNSTHSYYDTSHSFTFRDYDNGEISSTRIYDDVFPNELSEKYNMDNYLKTIYNDNGDEDPSNDLVLQAPALEDLLNLSHPTDNVPAIFDRSIIINSPAVFDNILATSKTVIIPDSMTDNTKSTAILNIIEVTPSDGVFVDSNSRTAASQVKRPGSYWHYDSSNDGIFDSIYVVDEDNNIIGVGFDYDYDSYLEPNKKLFVNKHIIKTGKIDFGLDDSTYNSLIKDSRVYLADSDTYNGYFLDSTFSDSLFDLWKIQYTSSTSKLMAEVKAITSRQFVQAMQGRLVGDIVFQVTAQLTAYGVGAIVSSVSGPLAPVLGPLAYLVTYGVISAINAAQQADDNAQDIVSLTTKQASYEGDVTLSSKKAADELWGGSMTDAIGWSTSGTYTSIHLETDKHLYKGEVLLAARGLKKTNYFGAQNVPISLNYEKQTRSYIGYSDFDDDRLNDYFFIKETYIYEYQEWEKITPIDNDINYMGNTIMYLEDAISEETDGEYYNIFPYMQYQTGVFIPTLQFSGEDTGHPLPEFYRDYPIYLEPEHYDELNDKHKFYTIYKVYDASSQHIELIPENVTRSIFARVDSIEVTFKDTLGTDLFKKRTFKASDDMFTFDSDTGIIALGPIMYNSLLESITTLKDRHVLVQDYDAYYIFEVKIEKYRARSDLNGMTQEEVDQIATMQALEQNILEYMYQYRQAQKAQQALSEMFYTALVTTISTVITTRRWIYCKAL
ncbi:hypothetical protein LCGC14_1003690 [marine sediment metagenome]|uniref:Uncharacterized protein n=1 Tax=marine sediment metagenome TaxID=412755 RepID=A0A0F9N2A6_9ZZZZ